MLTLPNLLTLSRILAVPLLLQHCPLTLSLDPPTGPLS